MSTGAASLRVREASGVLEVVIDRPEKRNALSRPLLAELKAVFAAYAKRDSLQVAVLTGAGDKSFAAGGDLRELASVHTPEETRHMAENGRDALDAIRSFPVPVVAVLNGDALGGGAELAVACDFRVAASHAQIGFIQGKLNISTAWGGGSDLMRLVGPTPGLRLLASAQRLSAEEALRAGVVDAVAAPGEPLQCALERFIAPLRAQVPQVLRAFKALAMASRRGAPPGELRALETRHLVETWVHPDHRHAADRILKPRSPE